MANHKQDLDSLINSVVDADFDLSSFRKVNDSHLPKAKNFFEWCTGRDFCDTTVLPWQLEHGFKLFSDYCPVCSNPAYVDNLYDQTIAEIQDNVVFLENGVCPKCHQNRLELFLMGEIGAKPSLKNESTQCVGQRSGKCLEAGTLVMTPTGPVEIEKLQVGDQVYGYNRDGSVTPCKVLNVFDQGVQPVTELLHYGNKYTACTDNHKWLVEPESRLNRRGERVPHRPERREERTLSELKNYHSFSREFVKIPGGDVHEPHAYVLGALAGDGCSRQGTPYRVDISAASEHVPHRVCQILGATPKKYSSANHTWCLYGEEPLQINHYADWISGRYAHEKIIDLEIVKTWDRASRLGLLAGLLDTDGNVTVAKNKYGQKTSLVIGFTSQSQSLIKAFQYLVISLFQVKMHESQDNRSKYKNGPCYTLQLKSNFHNQRILRELDPYLVHESRKWKPEYETLPIRNTNPHYVKLTQGTTYSAQTYDIEVDNETSLFLLAEQGIITHNSKSVALFTSYQLHDWLSIPDPISFYSLSTNELVVGSFSALTAEQAEENLWIPFKNLYEKAPWFEKYNAFLAAEQKRLSMSLFEVKETYISYKHKSFIAGFTGSNDKTKRGRTRLWGAIDEIAFFSSEENKRSRKKVGDADSNYEALANSLSTIRLKAMNLLKKGHHSALTAYMYNASSPLNVQDKIMRLVKEAAQNPWSNAVHKATWEANPDYPDEISCRAANSGISAEDFRKNFGAVPPFSDAPYIDMRSMQKLCQNVPPILDTEVMREKDAMGDEYLFLRAKPIRNDYSVPRLLSLDMGYNKNAFSLTIFKYDVEAAKPVLEFAVSLWPQNELGLKINFPQMYENCILPIVKAFKIRHVFYDRWQSIDQIQRLRGMGIDARAHSLSFEKDFSPFKQQLLSGGIVIPELEMQLDALKEMANPILAAKGKPITTLVWQAVTVRETLRKVEKPMLGDDDLFRAFVLGASRFMSEEILKEYQIKANGRFGQDGRGLISGVGLTNAASAKHGPGVPVDLNSMPFRSYSSGRGRRR